MKKSNIKQVDELIVKPKVKPEDINVPVVNNKVAASLQSSINSLYQSLYSLSWNTPNADILKMAKQIELMAIENGFSIEYEIIKTGIDKGKVRRVMVTYKEKQKLPELLLSSDLKEEMLTTEKQKHREAYIGRTILNKTLNEYGKCVDLYIGGGKRDRLRYKVDKLDALGNEVGVTSDWSMDSCIIVD